jgi:hypothetical protein
MAEYIQSVAVEDKISKPQLRSLRTKKPFTRVLPYGHYEHGTIIGEVREETPVQEQMLRKRITQEDFLRELDPSGHIINDREYYPDIWRQNTDENDKQNFGKWFIQEVPRYAFSFQQVILNKRLTHLCGNDIQFELADKDDNDKSNQVFNEFKRGWAKKNMEVAWYKSAKSVKATGDGAFIGYMDHGKFGWKVVSFLNGDRLYPHYDMQTGKLMCFVREFTDYDESGAATTDYMEVWDDKYYYRFSTSAEKPTTLWGAIVTKVKALFGTDGYVCEAMTPHNFPFIPISYMRDDNGPCWTFSEETIENYEMAFSRLAQSNHDFGLPIMYVKGEGSTELSNADLTHASKIFFLPSDGEIGFLNRQDASAAYNAELEKLEEQIYKQSFTVKAPELKSGDTPGVAIKLMYSDAYEKAMIDSQEYDDFIDNMVNIFQYGYGVESKMLLDFQNVNISHYIKPYVHQNDENVISNLAMAVQNGFISKQTAAEKNPYSIPSEWARIQKEKKEQAQMDLLLQEQKLDVQNTANVDMQGQLIDMQTDANIKAAEAQADINNDIETKGSSNSGSSDDNSSDDKKKVKKVTVKKGSVATGGRGGRPVTVGTDKWGNRANENNWRNWDMMK